MTISLFQFLSINIKFTNLWKLWWNSSHCIKLANESKSNLKLIIFKPAVKFLLGRKANYITNSNEVPIHVLGRTFRKVKFSFLPACILCLVSDFNSLVDSERQFIEIPFKETHSQDLDLKWKFWVPHLPSITKLALTWSITALSILQTNGMCPSLWMGKKTIFVVVFA